jgi:hypothetical protein
MVHPVRDPPPMNRLPRIKAQAGISAHSLNALARPNARSKAPIMFGTSQLPKYPKETGITNRKIIVRAWVVRAL